MRPSNERSGVRSKSNQDWSVDQSASGEGRSERELRGVRTVQARGSGGSGLV